MKLPFDDYGLNHCKICLYPESKPNMVMGDDGVCTTCRAVRDYYDKTDWEQKWQELRHLALKAKTEARQRGCQYDCVVPVSAGKDSVFICHTMKSLGLRVLGIFCQPVIFTPRGERNLQTFNHTFPVFVYRTPGGEMPKLLWDSFVKDGLPLQPFDNVIYGIPERTAADMGIPLVMRGEASEKFYGNRPEEAQQYDHLNTINEYLSNFVPWSSQVTAEFAIGKGLEIRTPDELRGTGGCWMSEQLDDPFPIVSHYLKMAKYCYNRVSDHVARDLRDRRIPTDTHPVARKWKDAKEEEFAYKEAARLIWKYWGQIDHSEYTDVYCRYVGKTREEFLEVAKRFDKYGVI